MSVPLAGAAPSRRKMPVLVQASIAILALAVLVVLFAPLLMPYPIDALDIRGRLQPPVGLGGDWDHVLGTDVLGRDVLSLTLRGAQVSLAIAFIGTVVGATAGTVIGFLAARFGGVVDAVVGALIDFQATLPFLVLALALLAVLPDASFGMFVALMCIYRWEYYARLARGLALSAKEEGYVLAERAVGAGWGRIYLRNILPNIAAVLVVTMTWNFPATIIVETSLGFLGVGIEPPETSLGVLIGEGREHLARAPWIALVPGVVVFTVTCAMSILGDHLRDRLDVEA